MKGRSESSVVISGMVHRWLVPGAFLRALSAVVLALPAVDRLAGGAAAPADRDASARTAVPTRRGISFMVSPKGGKGCKAGADMLSVTAGVAEQASSVRKFAVIVNQGLGYTSARKSVPGVSNPDAGRPPGCRRRAG